MKYSIIVPFFNEEGNIISLNEELIKVINSKEVENRVFEIIYVDDGSTDNTFKNLSSLDNPKNIKTTIIKHRRNIAQSVAILTGKEKASYDNLIFLDGDLQNDPQDIPKLIKKFEEGCDMIVGWRKNRQDPFFAKTLPSVIANFLIRFFTNSKIHDHGCALKVLKKEIFDEIIEWGADFHRLLAARAADMGFKIVEMPVNHRSRKSGKSKYGFSRIVKVMMDIIYLGFLKNKRKSLYYFGMFGFASIFCSLIVFCIMIYWKYFVSGSFILTPLPTLAIFFLLTGINFILIGIIAQILIIKNSQKEKETETGEIEKTINKEI